MKSKAHVLSFCQSLQRQLDLCLFNSDSESARLSTEANRGKGKELVDKKHKKLYGIGEPRKVGSVCSVDKGISRLRFDLGSGDTATKIFEKNQVNVKDDC